MLSQNVDKRRSGGSALGGATSQSEVAHSRAAQNALIAGPTERPASFSTTPTHGPGGLWHDKSIPINGTGERAPCEASYELVRCYTDCSFFTRALSTSSLQKTEV